MKKPFAITLDVGTSLENRTGSWRTLRPTYVHKLPPCNHQCPAGEDIQGWLFYAESGNYEKAWRHLTKRNPLPSCMGRVCYHTCEGACNRGKLDASVGINSVERFLGDNALENGYKFVKPEQKTGKKVLIVGSGPAGLSAAYQLALKGHEVTIKEGSPEAGGMMRYGIPKYRLPRRVLDQEIARILDLGVKLELARNNLNYLMYPTRGLRQSISAIYVSGLEYYTPGTFAPTADSVEENRYWFGARFTREQYFRIAKWFSLGYLVDGVITTHPSFSNEYATNISSPAFQPGLPEGFPQQVDYRRRNHPDVRIRTEVLFEKQRLCVFAGRCEQKYGRRAQAITLHFQFIAGVPDAYRPDQPDPVEI